MIRIMAKPRDGVTYDGYLDGKLLVGMTENVFTDAARALLDKGYAPTELMTMRWFGSAHDAFNPVAVGVAAALEVRSNNDGRPVFRRKKREDASGSPTTTPTQDRAVRAARTG